MTNNNFKVDKLGFYETGMGHVVKIIYIDSKNVEYDSYEKGPIVGIYIIDREITFYDKSGRNIEHQKNAPSSLIKYLGDTPVILIDSVGYYKNRAGNTVKVIHICDRNSSSSPVFVIDEGTGKFYTTNIYGKSDSTENLDLVEFVSR